MVSISPYLLFDGKAEAAFNFYKSVFGGAFSDINYFRDMPDGEKLPAEEQHRIMHIAYPLKNGSMLYGSDTLPSMQSTQNATFTIGDNFQLSITAESEAEATQLFNALSAGGKITMPLEKTFWNAYFGMLEDKFGTTWMINYDYPKEGA